MTERSIYYFGHAICILWVIQLRVCGGVLSHDELVNKCERILQENVNCRNDIKMVVKENADLQKNFKMIVKENADLQKNFKMVAKENTDLRNEFNMAVKENTDLQNNLKMVTRDLLDRVTTLEQDHSDQQLMRGRRQSPIPRVAFSAYLDHQLIGLGTDQPITYNRILTNDGNGYNGLSGIFVVPITGLYLFSWSATAKRLGGQDGYDVWVYLVIDGVHMLSAVAESRDEWDDNQGSNTVVVRVNQGQQVWTIHHSVFDKIHGDDTERATSFTGVLLYESE